MPVEAVDEIGTSGRMRYIHYSVDELQTVALREPSNPMPHYLMAYVYRRRGDSKWREAVDTALSLPHTAPQHWYARALRMIECGDWSGWAYYNARFSAPDTIEDLEPYREICWKRLAWDGTEDLSSKSILVVPEQGNGDCLQMWRFIHPLTERAGQVYLMVYPRLLPLARRSFGPRVHVILHHVKPTVKFDRYIFSMSLPSALGKLPAFEALRAPGRRAKLPARPRRLRGGICWAGNPDYLHDDERSIPIRELASVIERQDIEWYALQVGERLADAVAFPVIRFPEPPLVTFGDTADLMAELDFVVTVDTSVCHLAGNLGVPTYSLLQYDSHWRWGLLDGTPWYPTMQFVRQDEPDDWGGAVAKLNELIDARYG
jgi:hypothetical protein